jgi:hypothetical protein
MDVLTSMAVVAVKIAMIGWLILIVNGLRE